MNAGELDLGAYSLFSAVCVLININNHSIMFQGLIDKLLGEKNIFFPDYMNVVAMVAGDYCVEPTADRY